MSHKALKKWRSAARGHVTREILNDEGFRELVRSLEERYPAALDPRVDRDQPSGAFDARYPLERPADPPGAHSRAPYDAT